MWQSLIPEFLSIGIEITLILPVAIGPHPMGTTTSMGHGQSLRTQQDFLWWPRRVFERGRIRSRILDRYITRHDVFHSTYESVPSQNRIPSVVTIHDLYYEKFERLNPTRWTNANIARRRYCLARADSIVCVSKATRSDLLETYPDLVPDIVTVVHLAAASLGDEPLMEQEQAIIDAASDRPFLLYVGNRTGYKNFELLARGLKDHPNLQDLRVVAVGGEPADLHRPFLDRLGLASRFLFLGATEDRVLRELYMRAVALVSTSLYEGFGLPILEAQAHGCPVVASAIPAHIEVAGPGAVLYAPDSALELTGALMSASADRERLIRTGHENSSKFSWKRAAEELSSLYRDLVAHAIS